MASADLPAAQRASYSAIIDDILSTADLDSISAKAIRKGLQAKVDYDLSEQKDQITALIMERFDKVQRERESGATNGAVEPAPTTNGATHVHEPPAKITARAATEAEPAKSPSNKRKATEANEDAAVSEDDGDLSDVQDTPPPKKKSKGLKPETAESDEQMAKRLQAEFSTTRGRATRGGGASATKKKTSTKPVKKTKKKSAAKINSDDDSDVDRASGSPKPEKERKGGFHKPMNLSEPLQDLLGASTLSRPQTVKRIWAYVKERDLQDPNDKRQIRCDDKMRAVFKSEKVHMFTMNKVLAGQLYPVEEAA